MSTMTKDGVKRGCTLMTRPDGLPAEVPNKFVSKYRDEKGFTIGYTVKEKPGPKTKS